MSISVSASNIIPSSSVFKVLSFNLTTPVGLEAVIYEVVKSGSEYIPIKVLYSVSTLEVYEVAVSAPENTNLASHILPILGAFFPVSQLLEVPL